MKTNLILISFVLLVTVGCQTQSPRKLSSTSPTMPEHTSCTIVLNGKYKKPMHKSTVEKGLSVAKPTLSYKADDIEFKVYWGSAYQRLELKVKDQNTTAEASTFINRATNGGVALQVENNIYEIYCQTSA